jgi:hypothetical protein
MPGIAKVWKGTDRQSEILLGRLDTLPCNLLQSIQTVVLVRFSFFDDRYMLHTLNNVRDCVVEATSSLSGEGDSEAQDNRRQAESPYQSLQNGKEAQSLVAQT